jgi:DNA-binding NtrC family response regulator
VSFDVALEEGRMRRDLYYRLNVFTLESPPLRERKTDIPLLAQKFMEEANEANGCSTTGFEPETLDMLRRYDWPGNVRELRNVIERAVILAGDGLIAASHLSISAGGSDSSLVAHTDKKGEEPDRGVAVLRVGTSLDEAVRTLLLKTLEATGNNKTRAAKILGISPKTIYNKLNRWNGEMRRWKTDTRRESVMNPRGSAESRP